MKLSKISLISKHPFKLQFLQQKFIYLKPKNDSLIRKSSKKNILYKLTDKKIFVNLTSTFKALTRNSRYEISLMEIYNKQPGKSGKSFEHPKYNHA